MSAGRPGHGRVLAHRPEHRHLPRVPLSAHDLRSVPPRRRPRAGAAAREPAASRLATAGAARTGGRVVAIVLLSVAAVVLVAALTYALALRPMLARSTPLPARGAQRIIRSWSQGSGSPGASTRPRILATSSRCSRRRSRRPSSVWRRGREPGTRRRDITSPTGRRTARGSSSPSSRCGPGTPTTWTGSPTTSPSSGARRASTRLPR